MEHIDDFGAVKLLQGVIQSAFNDAIKKKTASEKKTASDVLRWAKLRRRNKWLIFFDEIFGYDCDRVADSLIAKCEETMGT